MTWKMSYRFTLFDVSIAAAPVAIFNVGYAVPGTLGAGLLGAAGGEQITETITSLSRAISKGLSLCRAFNSLGKDVIAQVGGMPIGADEAGATPLPANAQLEYKYADIDVPSSDLRRAIGSANHVVGGTAPGTDFATDLGTVSVL